MASKTREKLIEAAKQLFIHKGVENTTISDIANASDKGRRTIYTYFKNKKEIYKAVIERESDKMVRELKMVTDQQLSASEKLVRFLNMRMTSNKNASSPYSTIKSLISIDFGRTEKTRRLAYEKEEHMLNSIINEGIASGEFDSQRAQELKRFIFPLIKLIDLSTANEDASVIDSEFAPSIISFLLTGIKEK